MKNLKLYPKESKGMTLIEILVSLLILSIIMAGILIILQVQQSRAISVRSQAVLHTEAQVALSILKWDIFMAGFAMGNRDTFVIDGDGVGWNFTDRIRLKAAVLGLESKRGRWNYIIEGGRGTNSVKVRRWDDPGLDFIVNDTVFLANPQDKVRRDSFIITRRDSSYTPLPRYEPAWTLTFDHVINASMGEMLFMYDHSTLYQGVGYEVKEVIRAGQPVRVLVRNYSGRDEILLENVEDFQVQYGVDANNDGFIAGNEWQDRLTAWVPLDNQDSLRSLRFMVRFGVVTTTDRPIPNYTYPQATITLFNHTYNIVAPWHMYRRVMLFEEVVPRNLKQDRRYQ